MNETRPSARGIADIVFLLDATGSMRPCIQAVRESISGFVAELERHSASGVPLIRDWRARVVAYRDRPDNPADWIEEHPFVNTAHELAWQLGGLSAHGGGTEPESLLDALYHLVTAPPGNPSTPKGRMSWRPRGRAHRFVIVFTDATYHPTFHTDSRLGPVELCTIDDVRERIQDAGLWLHLFTPDFDCYGALSEIDRCKWVPIPLAGDPKDDFDWGTIGARSLRQYVTQRASFDEVLRQLGRSISQSATAGC